MAPNNLTSIEEAMEYAIESIARGDTYNGKAALSWVLRQSPSLPEAWIWMACCVDSEDQKRDCYRRIS
jgi:hypothetical protein